LTDLRRAVLHAALLHVIGQSHNRRGTDCTLASWDGRRGRQYGSRLDQVVSNSGSALLTAYARWGVACLHDPRQQRQLIKGLKQLRFMRWTTESL